MSGIVTSLGKPFDYKIHIPEIFGQYDFAQGLTIANQHVTNQLKIDFVNDRLRLNILFPEGLEQYSGGKPKILGEFFVGLLGSVVKDLTDKKFSHIQPEIHRNKLRDVKREVTAQTVFNQIFGAVWPATANLEEDLAQKIKIGISLQDGRESQDIEAHPFLAHALAKYSKAIDMLFITNFQVINDLKGPSQRQAFRHSQK